METESFITDLEKLWKFIKEENERKKKIFLEKGISVFISDVCEIGWDAEMIAEEMPPKTYCLVLMYSDHYYAKFMISPRYRYGKIPKLSENAICVYILRSAIETTKVDNGMPINTEHAGHIISKIEETIRELGIKMIYDRWF